MGPRHLLVYGERSDHGRCNPGLGRAACRAGGGGCDRGGLAGPAPATFIPSFVPFAALDDYHYFVDTRPGTQHGCVTEYAHEAADERGPVWDSIAAMLTALASSLQKGTEFRHWTPVVTQGVLDRVI